MNWEKIAKAHVHPLRLAILQKMEDGYAISPNQLSQHLKQPLGNVSYHVRVLAELKLIRETHQEQKRGAMEHFYRLV